MDGFVRLCALVEAPKAGTVTEMQADGRAICVANIDGELSALDNVCPHRQGPLGEGIIEDGAVVCPWHGWAFDAKTGEGVHNPGMRVDAFPLKVESGDVWIKF